MYMERIISIIKRRKFIAQKLLGSKKIYLFFSITWLILFNGCKQEKNKIRIAVVGPFAEQNENPQATSIRHGVALALENMEHNKSITENFYEFDFISDKGDPKQAAAIAEKIGKEKKYVAVIGHLYSAPSLAAAPLYKKYHIPAITLGATNNAITENNPWYFRTIFNDKLQGEYLANYVYDIMKTKQVAIIKENKPYGNYLAKIFSDTITKRGVAVDSLQTVSTEQPDSISNVIQKLREKKYKDPIFLAVHPEIGIKLVRAIKNYDAQIKLIGPDALATEHFIQGFKDDIKEKENPGFYSKDLVVSSPFILDIAGNDAQSFNSIYVQKYKQKVDWTAALAYDTAQLLLTGLNTIDCSQETDTVSIDRIRLKQYLSDINTKSKAVKGITGNIYFNANGDSQRPVSIGVYRGKNSIISALKQYSEIVVNSENENFIAKEKAAGHIITIAGKNMYRTNIVYVGTQVNSLSNLEVDKMHCNIDFYLWFRCQGNFSIDNINFLNAENSKELSIKKIESSDENMINYQLYRIKGFFKLDYLDTIQKFHEHTVGFSLKHTFLTRNNLIFVPDFLGGSMEVHNISVEKSHQLLNPEYLMIIKEISAYQDIFKQPMFGHPDYLLLSEAIVDFSYFNFRIAIKKHDFSDTLLIPIQLQKRLFIIAIIVMIFSFILIHMKSMKLYERILWVLQFFSTMIFIFCSRTFFLNALVSIIGIYASEIVDTTYNILFLMVPAYFIVRFLHYFIWEPLERKTGQNFPDLLKKITAFIIYLLASFGVLALVYHKQINSLLATSGFIAMVFGYAVRMNLANIFSGIVVNTDRSFNIGDSVRFGSKYEGRIIDMNWRTISMINKENNILSVPNHLVADMDIVNLNRSKGALSADIKIEIENIFPPDRIRKILFDAVFSTNEILLEPKPIITIESIDSNKLQFLISFYVKTYQRKAIAKETLWNRLWVHLYAADIHPACKNETESVKTSFSIQNPESIINIIDLFTMLSKEEKTKLIENIKVEKYKKGSTIIVQGDMDKSIYIIAEGVVIINRKTVEHNILTLERLGVGNVIGEKALLTNQPRNANVEAFSDTVIFHISEEIMYSDILTNKIFKEHLQELCTKHIENSVAKITQIEKKIKKKPLTFFEKITYRIKGN